MCLLEKGIADSIVVHIIPEIEILVKDCYTLNNVEFKDFPPHCIRGTSEAELVDELKKV